MKNLPVIIVFFVILSNYIECNNCDNSIQVICLEEHETNPPEVWNIGTRVCPDGNSNYDTKSAGQEQTIRLKIPYPYGGQRLYNPSPSHHVSTFLVYATYTFPEGVQVIGPWTDHNESFINVSCSGNGVSISSSSGNPFWSTCSYVYVRVILPNQPLGHIEVPYAANIVYYSSSQSGGGVFNGHDSYFVRSSPPGSGGEKPLPNLEILANPPGLLDYPLKERVDLDLVVRNSSIYSCRASVLAMDIWEEKDLANYKNNENGNWNRKRTINIPALGPNESFPVVIEDLTTTIQAEYWNIKYVIDPNNYIEELNEEDNEKELQQLIGWYEPPTLSGFSYPTSGYFISSVLNEPRPTKGSIDFDTRFHSGTDFTGVYHQKIKSMSSGKIIRNISDKNKPFKTTYFEYYHVYISPKYDFKNSLVPGRWIIADGQVIGEIGGEEKHVHVNDYSHNVREEDPISMQSQNPIRKNGLSPSEIDMVNPKFIDDPNKPVIKFFVDGTANNSQPLSNLNLSGLVDIVAYCKDMRGWYTRRGIAEFSYKVYNSLGHLLYDSGICEIANKKIIDEDYDKLYTTVYTNRDNDHESGFFGIKITSRVKKDPENTSRVYMVHDGNFDTSILPINELCELRVEIDDFYQYGSTGSDESIVIKRTN